MARMSNAWEDMMCPLRQQLLAATTEDEVLDIVNAFLDRWTPEQVLRFPPEFPSEHIKSAEDLIATAVHLESARTQSRISEDHWPVFQKMASFFKVARGRLPEIYRDMLHSAYEEVRA